jgi:hypothetical protein
MNFRVSPQSEDPHLNPLPQGEEDQPSLGYGSASAERQVRAIIPT